MISAKDVAALRERTGVGLMECKRALTDAAGDPEGALKLLREWGHVRINKPGRATNEGAVGMYVDTEQKLGIMVELVCETRFRSQNA